MSFRLALKFTKIKKGSIKKKKKETNWAMVVKNGIGRMSESGISQRNGKNSHRKISMTLENQQARLWLLGGFNL